MRKLLLLSICLASALLSHAQTPDKRWNIGLHAGATQYKGDLGSDFYKTDMSLYGFGGVSISRYLGKHFDANLFVTKGQAGYNRSNGKFKQDMSSATLNVRFHILGPKSPVRPYVFVGAGAMLFDRNIAISKARVDYIAPSFGGGINFRLGESFMINVQETFFYSTSDLRDGVDAGENDGFLLHTVGLTFNLGKKKDEDKDGVADRMDKCPGTPASVAVDKNGCPVDKDADGVADYIDQCPDVAGTKGLNGCPDKDGDGVGDKEDMCPDVAGLASFNGCPDKDGDGVGDKEDRCPDVAGIAALKGCPDSDGDKVVDEDDKCPNTKKGYIVDLTGCPLDNDKDAIVNEEDLCPDAAGTAVFKGCPDTDGDGVGDNEDRCPKLMGTIANKGCPEITKEDVKKITQIASKIFFETNSDKLKVASLAQLDELSLILKKYEAANLSIEGHTDSQGEDEFNRVLSEKRSASVKNYLMGKGIMESRLSTKGFGETVPIGDNNTSDGRARNRRVELKTSY